MSGFLRQSAANHWFFARGKYAGQTLRDVANDDPDYFRWVHRKVDDLTKEQVEALEEIAGEEGIDL